MKYMKTFEDLSWTGNILGQDIGDLAEFSDSYFKMVLKDVDVESEGKLILHVEFFEKNNPQFNGKGTFRYYKSDIPGLTGDIVPVKMDGILEEIFYDDEEIIYDFLSQLVNDVSY